MYFYTALDRADLGLPTPDLRIQYPPCSPVVGNRILVTFLLPFVTAGTVAKAALPNHHLPVEESGSRGLFQRSSS
jgi:hypothetical protein